MTLPNLISLARLFCVPVVIWLLVEQWFLAAFWVFVLAGVSDAVDGWLAKRFAMASKLGAHLDAIADKTLLVCIYVALGVLGLLDSWLVILVVSRDVLIVGALALSYFADLPVTIRPSLASKANTTLQIALAASVLGAAGYGVHAELHKAIEALAFMVAVSTVVSGIGYLARWVRGLSQGMKRA